jgi:hypothetical protein
MGPELLRGAAKRSCLIARRSLTTDAALDGAERGWIMRINVALSGVAVSLLLAACGGGGGGDGTRSLMTLTEENAPATTAGTWGALGSGEIFFDGDFLAPLGATSGSTGTPAGVAPVDILQDAVTRLNRSLDSTRTVGLFSDADDPVVSPQQTETYACSVSGSVLINQTSPTSGYVEFQNCTEYDGTVYGRLNGRVEINDLQITEGACVDTLSVSARFLGLSAAIYTDLAAAPIETATIDGAVNVNESANSCTGLYELRLSGPRLQLTTTNESAIYQDFDIHGVEIGDTTDLSLRVTLDVLSLPGSIIVTTPVPVRTFWYETYPHQGQVRLVGADGGFLLLTINASSGPNAVSIVGDFDNDGQIDCSVAVSWQQIASGSWSCTAP